MTWPARALGKTRHALEYQAREMRVAPYSRHVAGPRRTLMVVRERTVIMTVSTSLESREFCLTPTTRAARPRPSSRPIAQLPPAGRPLRLKIAESRKAVVGGIGAIVSTVVPLSPFLPAGVTHWLAAAAAVLTGFATYLTKNSSPTAAADPPVQAVTESPPLKVLEEQPVVPPARHAGPVLAGLALVVGGAVLAGRHTERHSRCVTPFALLPPGGFPTGR